MAIDPAAKAVEAPTGTLQRVEDVVLSLLLGAMILLAPAQILLRGVLGTGISWVDPLLRVLVLWLGLLGAVAASWEGRHITIDALSRLLPHRARAAAGAVSSLFTAVATAFVAYHGARFVASEYRFESAAFSGLPAWPFESVIPFSFAAIALRYLRLAVSDLAAVFRGGGDEQGAGAEGGAQ
ncbi:MAG: TRAP transporter small permease [Myxococcota bacterium]|nr:TRAP transporter small permease [Myxococcota bacterium]